MNPQDFYNAWIKCSSKFDLYSQWASSRSFTNIVFKEKNSIIKALGESLDLLVHTAYYSTDAVFYESSDLVPGNPPNRLWKTPGGTWLRKIRVAFEHENVFAGNGGVFQEICHLLTVNADLGVVVSYPDPYGRKNEEFVSKAMEDLSGLLTGVASKNKPLLVILGYLNESEKRVGWEAWVNEDNFFRLTKW